MYYRDYGSLSALEQLASVTLHVEVDSAFCGPYSTGLQYLIILRFEQPGGLCYCVEYGPGGP